jgi:hypothetical protein
MPTATGQIESDELNNFNRFLQELSDMGKSDKPTDILTHHKNYKTLVKANDCYQQNRYIKALSDFLWQNGYKYIPRILSCFQNKDNPNLVRHMNSLLDKAGDLSKYPPGKNNIDTQLIAVPGKFSKLPILNSSLSYTFFIDRVMSDTHSIPRATPYGDDMFGKTNDVYCDVHYLHHCFQALTYLFNCGCSFSESTDPHQLFDILTETNKLACGKSCDDVIHPAAGSDGYIHLFYECEDNNFDSPNFGNRSFFPQKLLNLRVSVWCDVKEINNMALLSEYISKEEKIQFFSKHLKDYQHMLQHAVNPSEITTAIVIFISLIEASHYFGDSNNRMSCQMQINKLLEENNLPQTILYVPNGFSRYVLGILPWQVRLGVVDITEIPISVLTAYLEPALMMVREGQDFYSKILQSSDCS